MRVGRVVGIVATLLAVAAPAAVADVEPNDGITQAEGPLAGATIYRGVLSTDNDVDWYSFYVAGQTQLDIAVTIPADSPCGGWFDEIAFRDADGASISTIEPDVNTTEHIRYTTPPGINRYFLVADACSGYRYQFRIDPGAAVVAGPGIVVPAPTGEPNETADQAFGPLLGATSYAGRIETQNDDDWFYFFTVGPTALDVAVTGTASTCSPYARLYSAADTDSSLASASIDLNQTDHLTYTAGGAAKYLIEVEGDGCIDAAYQLRVDPGNALAPALPAAAPAPAPIVRPRPGLRCLRARSGVRRWRGALRRTRAKLHVVETRHARRALRRKAAAQRRTLRRAKDRVTIYCS